ncbi:hypothetical protein [Alteromonas sp. KUL49]|uniref:hypothetical protein n=1 Tax=Alteromonas sp. KUL49 TaxID=2480798 RepID=UPI00102EFE7E|nr:hypothetical protein [Alteromonas sp. KUL49]TAP38732.1 hypothetical protein EYS00_15125 [Alteromonas sp. KUL49]GEA12687.1 hypothetical protein KUL49_30620 [Alteromonas sp. KUL49]
MERSHIRVVDTVLSKIALGFAVPGLVGHELFPHVNVDAASGKIIQFDKSAFRLINTRRAPGTQTKRVTVGFEAGNYSLTNNGLDAVIPKEWLDDEKQVPGINLRRQSVETVMQIELNHLEFEQSSLARNADNYSINNKETLSGADQWSDYESSNPIKDVKDKKEAIRSKTGRYPNKMVIPALVHNALCEHPVMLAKLSDSKMKILTVEDYQRIFDIKKVVIAGSVVVDDSDNFEDLWGVDVILAVVPETITTRAMPSFGYTYRRTGHPSVEKTWFDKSVKSWISGVEYERAPLLTGIESGFLLKNVVAE